METLIASGKTKRVFRINDTDCGELEDQDVITWDDEFSAEVPDKGIWATETTCNIFELLARHGIPTAYLGRSENLRRLRVQLCEMIPLEVIVRLENAKNSSYGKRYPDVPIGPLPMPVVEFNLKTVKQVFNGHKLPWDDPLILEQDSLGMTIGHPKQFTPAHEQVDVPYTQTFGIQPTNTFVVVRDFAMRVGVILRDEFAKFGWNLSDFKLEFGILPDGTIVLADVVDNDSWRLQDPKGVERSKQIVRNAGRVTLFAIRSYKLVAKISAQFLT